MSVRKVVAVDGELVAAVQRVLSTATLNEAVEEALREVLRVQARHDEVQALTTMSGMDLMDENVMSRAWR